MWDSAQNAHQTRQTMPDRWMALFKCLRRYGISSLRAREAGFIGIALEQQRQIKMNQDQFAGIWKQFRGKVKVSWGQLTHNSLVVAAGRCDQLAGSIQERYGISKAKSARQLKDFLDRNRNWYRLSR